jgi:hypothetical protein
MRARSVVFLALTACVPIAQAPPPAYSPADTQLAARASAARSMGYPTRKSAADLDAMIAQQTKDFARQHQHADGRLEAPAPFVIEGVKGTCYTVVMRLGAGASWGDAAEAGLRFDFRSPTGPGSGGPGVAGPGAVASVGCAEASGEITLTMAPLYGTGAIGQGPFSLEVWSHQLTSAEARHLEEDKQRQIREQQEFAERERHEREARATRGCSKCDARYQGCIGAGRDRGTCGDQYRSCAFEEVGADYGSACPFPR